MRRPHTAAPEERQFFKVPSVGLELTNTFPYGLVAVPAGLHILTVHECGSMHQLVHTLKKQNRNEDTQQAPEADSRGIR